MRLVYQEMGNTLSWTGNQSLVIFSVVIILSLRIFQILPKTGADKINVCLPVTAYKAKIRLRES